MERIKSQDIYGKHYDVPINELTWRPAAYAIIVHDSQILLVDENHKFHLPGGGIDLGEMPEAALVREVKEESGLNVANPRLVGSLSTFFTLSHRKVGEPEHVQSLLLYYACDLSGGELSHDGQQEDEKSYNLTATWVPITKLDHIVVGSTVDWRPIAKRAVETS